MTPVVRKSCPRQQAKGGNDSNFQTASLDTSDPQTNIPRPKKAKIRLPERRILESVFACVQQQTLGGKEALDSIRIHFGHAGKLKKVTALQVHSKNHIGDSPFPFSQTPPSTSPVLKLCV